MDVNGMTMDEIKNWNSFTNNAPIKELPIEETTTVAMYGWICPKCGRCLSPWTSECTCNYISLNGPMCNTRRFVYDFMTNPGINYTHQESVTMAHNG